MECPNASGTDRQRLYQLKKNTKNTIHGWINLDKPLGMTSTQAVGAVKRLLRPQKIGHAGTLDPLASGVLPLALGEATKTVPYLMDAGKTYLFTVKFGEETDSCDLEGQVVATSDRRPTYEQILTSLPAFTGVLSQVPPVFCAVKINGERAYDLARAGVEVEIKPRQVRVDSLRLLAHPDADHATFEARCGKGTYIRALARDIGLFLGTKAHVCALQRKAVGGFDESNIISLEKLEQMVHTAEPFAREGEGTKSLIEALKGALLPVSAGLDDIPAIRIGRESEKQLRHGQAACLPRTDFPAGEEGGQLYGALYQAVCFGELVAIVERKDNMIAPVRVFAPQVRN